jgi:hypothetical protein
MVIMKGSTSALWSHWQTDHYLAVTWLHSPDARRVVLFCLATATKTDSLFKLPLSYTALNPCLVSMVFSFAKGVAYTKECLWSIIRESGGFAKYWNVWIVSEPTVFETVMSTIILSQIFVIVLSVLKLSVTFSVWVILPQNESCLLYRLPRVLQTQLWLAK